MDFINSTACTFILNIDVHVDVSLAPYLTTFLLALLITAILLVLLIKPKTTSITGKNALR